MRTINEIMSKFERVWFVIADEYKSRFVDECNASGYFFNKGESLTLTNCGPYMALHAEDKAIWYISNLVLHTFFTNPNAFALTRENCIRLPVDYKAFSDGEQCFIYNMNKELVALEDYRYKMVRFPGALRLL